MELTQAARVQTLHLLMLRNISIGKHSISVWLWDNIKQCRPSNVQLVSFMLMFRMFDYVYSYRWLWKKYTEKTATLRKDFANDTGKLLISFIMSHMYAYKETVARWLKTMLGICRINTAQHTAGSLPSCNTEGKGHDCAEWFHQGQGGKEPEGNFC